MHIDRMIGISLGLSRRGYSWAYIKENGDIRSGEIRYVFDRKVAGQYMLLGFSRRDAYFGTRHDQFARFIERALPKLPEYRVAYDIPNDLDAGHICTEYGAQIGFLQLYCYRNKIPLTGIQRFDLHSRMTGLQRCSRSEFVNKINEKGHNVVSSSEARAIGLVYYANPNVWLSRGKKHDYTKLRFGDIDRVGDKKARQ